MTAALPAAPPTRATASADRPPPSPRSVTAVGVVAAVRSAGLGVLAVMVLVLVGWATAADSGADAADAVVTALQVWLVGAARAPGRARRRVGPGAAGTHRCCR